MLTPHSAIRIPHFHRGFTLMELLVVMMILAILVGMALVGLNAAVNDARAARTRTVINKIDGLLQDRWEEFRTRAVPLARTPNVTTAVAAGNRLGGLRELMRLEMPDRISDLCTGPEYLDLTGGDNDLDAIVSTNQARLAVLTALPSVAGSYKRQALRNMTTSGQPWTTNFQGAECLYLIMSVIKDGDKSALDFFSTDEVGDVDGDGFKEILDGWGRPIEFLRWAPGYSREQPGADNRWGVATADDNNDSVTDEITEFLFAGSDDALWPNTTQSRDSRVSPDPYDPVKVDPRWANVDPGSRPFAVRPLIYSAGLDGAYDTHIGTAAIDHAGIVPPNDPYLSLGLAGLLIGTPADSNTDGELSGDNITNHDNRGQ